MNNIWFRISSKYWNSKAIHCFNYTLSGCTRFSNEHKDL